MMVDERNRPPSLYQFTLGAVPLLFAPFSRRLRQRRRNGIISHAGRQQAAGHKERKMRKLILGLILLFTLLLSACAQAPVRDDELPGQAAHLLPLCAR